MAQPELLAAWAVAQQRDNSGHEMKLPTQFFLSPLLELEALYDGEIYYMTVEGLLTTQTLPFLAMLVLYQMAEPQSLFIYSDGYCQKVTWLLTG